ncbi:MAG: hypothetical protein ACRESX_03650 [Gammaproteobacteria bacterium]
MRSFSDSSGQLWQAALGHESHGSMVIIFSRLGSFDVFKSRLDANSRLDAENEIAALSEHDLCVRLQTAEPWS